MTEEIRNSLPTSSVERALRAGFGTEAGAGDAPSVIARLGLADDFHSRVVLRSTRDARDEPLLVGRLADGLPDPERGNFRVYGEVARGGMGSILKAYDADLGRDVALKILHGDGARDASIVRRFIEEAQIGGQLQHPGIVPVHELGLMSDRRPYFAMQLVQGRTLASLLAERAAPTDDLPRFLSIFERVCQTVAYAHARGVLHRDLKPANVMIGDFGEVQVVDWGLAKVLRRGGTADEAPRVATLRSGPRRAGSASLAGAVMGTPRYMPPEQARGEVDALDERVDVFSLGGILCEILTGAPPYEGDEDTLERAAEARLDPCFERLRQADLDPDLIALARAALCPSRDDRPRNASVLAQRARAYLDSLDERWRQAELREAEARGKAEEERRARRLTVALALAIVGLAGLTGGFWIWRQRELDTRRAETVQSVQSALWEADELERRATRTARVDDWVRARGAVDRARVAAEAGLAPPEFVDLVERRSTDLLAAERSSLAAHELDRRERALLAAIEALRVPEDIRQRMGSEQFYPTDWSWVAAAWDAAFQSAELPLREMRAADAARAVRELPSAPRVASAVDEWAMALRNAGEAVGASHLSAVARLADPDPAQTRVRDALEAGDVKALSSLAETEELDGLFPATLHLLGNTLGLLGQPDLAVEVLEFAKDRYPGDFPIALGLARWAFREREDAEVLAYYAAALALRPENVEVCHELGNVHYRRQELDRAIALYRRGLRFAPDDGHLWSHLGNTLTVTRRYEEAVEAMRRASELEPQEYIPWDNLGYALEALGRYEEALEPLARAIAIDPDIPNSYATRADCYAALERHAEAAEDLRRLCRVAPDTVYFPYQLGTSLHALGDFDGARAAWTRAREVDPNLADAALVLGQLLVQEEQYEAALPHLRDAVELTPDDAFAHALLGGALADSGASTEALEHLKLARALGLGDAELSAQVDAWTATAQAAEDR